MKIELPYMNAPGYIPRVFNKLIEAKTPPKFTQDFMGSVLGVASSSARQMIPFMKRLGLLASDGAPTDLYGEFRADGSRGHAAAIALRTGYAQLFDSNEYIYKVDDKKLLDAIIQITGLEKNSKSAKAIVSSFNAVNEYADFDSSGMETIVREDGVESTTSHNKELDDDPVSPLSNIGLSYTINLNLPATSDIAVFDAIFRSLKENILK